MRRLRPWFRELMIEHLALTDFRYRSSGLFELRRPETRCYLEFVPGKYPTPAESIVDVAGYLGITFLTLNSVFPMSLPPTTLHESYVHWFRSAGYINHETTGQFDWRVDKDDDASIDEFFDDLDDRIVTELLKRTTDEALLVEWTSTRDPFITPAQQAGYVAVLAAERGDWAAFKTALETIEHETGAAEWDPNRVAAGEVLDAVRGLSGAVEPPGR